MRDVIKHASIIILVLFIVLQLLPSSCYANPAYLLPGILSQPYDSPPILKLDGPDYVTYGESFEIEIALTDGNFSEVVSREAFLPKGFNLITYKPIIKKDYKGLFDEKKIAVYSATINAPERKVDGEKIAFKITYKHNNGNTMSAEGKKEMCVGTTLRKKYRLDPENVPSDYNGNIVLATAVESLPTVVPLGFFILGEKRERSTWVDSYTGDSFIPKIIETIFFGLAVNATTYNNQGASIIWLGAYTYTLIAHDLPNLFKMHDVKKDISKMKREGNFYD
ncbi:hypothetical protein ACFL52_04595 [Candidatus Margulisiibacteriota bacterium]